MTPGRASLMILPLMAALPAAAQETTTPPPAASGLEDVVVTARRVAERAQSVPVAITAYTAEAIVARSARTVGDLAAVTPNLTRTDGPTGGNDAFFFLRGVGQVDSNPANDPGVGVYIDGVYLARLQGASLDAQDLARIEVLRGPQGTLFGRNTIGGAINITSKDPGDALALEGRLTGGSYNRIDAYGAVDVPASDTLALRLSLATRNEDGFSRNVYTGQTFGDIHNLSGRIKAVWKPDSATRVTLAADYLRARGGSAPTVLTGFDPHGGAVIPGASPLGVPFPADLGSDRSGDLDRNFESIVPRNDLDNWGASLTADRTVGAVDVALILAYRRTRQLVNNDFDGTGYRFYDNSFDTGSNQYSTELHLSGKGFGDRLTWLVGGYGFAEEVHHDNAICLGGNLGGPFADARNTGGCLVNNQRFGLLVGNAAAFGQASFELTPTLSLTAGGRYTHEHKRQAFDFYLDNSAGVFNFFGIPPLAHIPTLSPDNPNVGVPTTYRASFNRFTPKLGAEWKPATDLLVYASWSEGFKSGGFNGRPSPNAAGGFDAIQAFGPETLDSYEVGVKSEFLDKRVRLNLAAFTSNYNGIQLLVLNPATGFFDNENAGRARIRGVEAELTARPVPALQVYANLGYTDAHYRYVNPLAIGIGLDNRLPATPEFNYSAGGSYRFDLQRHGAVEVRADWNYRSSVYYGAGNAPLEFQAGFGLLNLRATYTDPTDRFSLAAFGTNVLNKRYYSSAQDVRSSLGVAFATVGAPAEWGVEAGFKF